MWSKNSRTKFSKLYAVVDIVYNPGKTKLMSLASSCGVPNVIGGLKMLVAQGYKASLIFRHLDDELSADVAASVIDKAYKELEFKMKMCQLLGKNIREGITTEADALKIIKENPFVVVIITDEPGIYIPGKFGVRIEDVIRLTENGNIDITKSKKELLIL